MRRAAAPLVPADTRARSAGAVPSGNRRVPAPITSGNTRSRYSSTRSAAVSAWTTLALPMTTMSCSCLRFPASVTRSPRRTVEFCQPPACSSERDITSLGMAFILAENGSSRPGQMPANICQVRRPSSRAPVSSTSLRPNGSPLTASGPYRNAHPPWLNPSFPSGSCMTPSRDTNSMTMTWLIIVLSARSLRYRRARVRIGDSRRHRFPGLWVEGCCHDHVIAGRSPLETDFRHAGLASTGPHRMNATLMRLERHERGIHVV